MRSKIEKLMRQVGMAEIKFDSIGLNDLNLETHKINGAIFEYLNKLIPYKELLCAGIRVFNQKGIIEENLNLLPGCLVCEFGFISIAATGGGDVFVAGCEAGKIYELSHEKYNADSISLGWKPGFTEFYPDIPITRANIIATADGGFVSIEKFFDFLCELSSLG